MPNPERLLLPGMFANVAVVAGAAREVVIVPRTAVTYSLYGDRVYAVGSESADDAGALIVQRRLVRTGDPRQVWVAITTVFRVVGVGGGVCGAGMCMEGKY